MKGRLSILFFFFVLWGFSQKTKQPTFKYISTDLKIVLADVAQTYKVRFSYLNETIDTKISIVENKYTLADIIAKIEDSTALSFKKTTENSYVVLKNPKRFTRNHKDTIFEVASRVELLKSVFIQSYLARGISKNADHSFTIKPLKLAILPGLTEPDILKTLQQLPGVKAPNETVTGIHVRGGTGDQNLTVWDGIKMYHNGHLFGMISGFNPNINQEIHFYNKGTNPRFGDRVSSVIDIHTSSKIPKKIEISSGFNALSADIYVNAPIYKDKLSIQVSGRRSFTDYFKSPTFVQYSQKVFQKSFAKSRALNANRGGETSFVEETRNDFYYQDYNAKVNCQLSPSSSLFISGIYIDSNLDNDTKHPELTMKAKDKLGVSNVGYSVNWKNTWGDSNISHSISAYYSDYKLDYDNTKNFKNKSNEFFSKKNRVLDSGIEVEAKYPLTDNASVTGGYQLSGNHVQHNYNSGNDEFSLLLDASDGTINTHSFYSTFTYTKLGFLDFTGGFRYNVFAEIKKTSFEPRALLSIPFSKNLKMNISGEIKSQIINQINESVLSDLSLENQLWVLSNDIDFPVIKSNQLTTGITYKYSRWTLDLDTYYKQTKGITSAALGFMNINDSQLYHKGESISKGVDLYLKKDFKNARIWGTYSYNSVKNKFADIMNERLFPSSSEIKHSMNFSTAYKIKRIELAMGWYWHTGKPYTIANEATNAAGISYWKYTDINTERLSNYHRLDFSAMYNFTLSKPKKVKAKTGFSLYNMYNRDNILNIEYLTNNAPVNRLIKIEHHSLHFTPNLFFRVYF